MTLPLTALTLAAGAVAVLWPAFAYVAIVVTLLAVAVSAFWRRYGNETSTFSGWCLELLLLPLALSLRAQDDLYALLALAALCGIAFLRPTRSSPVSHGFALFVLLAAIVLVLSRPVSLSQLLIAVLALLILLRTRLTCEPKVGITSLIDGIGLYAIGNVVMHYLIGLTSSSAILRTGGLESSAGGDRIFFPLTTSLALAPIMAAAYIAAAVTLRERGQVTVFRLVALGCSFVILVGANSRVALVVAALIGIVTFISPRSLRFLSVPIAVFAAAFAFVFLTIQPIVGVAVRSVLSVAPGLSRNGGLVQDVTLNNRDLIWAQSLHFWQSNVDVFRQWFGYGAGGQEVSGASSTYANVFGTSLANRAGTSSHNSTLQQLFDGGIVGAALLAAATILLMIRLRRLALTESTYVHAALGVSIAFVLQGITEVTLSPGWSQESFWIFAGLYFFAFAHAESIPSGASQSEEVRGRDTMLSWRSKRLGRPTL